MENKTKNELLADLKQEDLSKVAKEYVNQRKLRKVFDKVADRVEFMEELETLIEDLKYVKSYFENEMKLIETNKLPFKKIDYDVVKHLKGYSVYNWKELIKKWESEL